MALNNANPELLGTQPIGKLLVRYALPAIIAMTSNSLYNIVDSIFIGKGVGGLSLSGLALTLPLTNLSAAFGAMVGVGAASLTSIRLGQGNKARAFLILSNAIMLNIIFGVLFAVAALSFLDPILNALGASPDTLPYARSYIKVLLYGNVVTHVYLGLNEILRASGYPQKSMTIMISAIAINFVLDWFCIYILKWGIAGAAIATMAAQCIALVIQFTHFLNKKNFLYIKSGTFRFIGLIVRKILTIGAAPFLLNACASFVVFFVNGALKNTGGDMAIGAYGNVNRVLLFFIMVVAGLNQGMQPIVGYNFGARQFDRVLKTLKLTITCAVGVMTVGFILGQIFPGAVAKMFTDDPTLIAITEQGLRVTILAFPIVGFQIVSSNFFQYIGQPQKAILLSMTRQLLFLLPMLAIFPPRYGTLGVWMSFPIADVLAAILAGTLLFFQVRQFRKHPEKVKVI